MRTLLMMALLCGAAHAQTKETVALKEIFKSASWTGSIKGEGAPPQKSFGKVRCAWIVDGLFAACDIDETIGKNRWKGHLVVGWDVEAKQYRALLADSGGSLGILHGQLVAKKLTLTSPAETPFHGQPTRFRLTFDAADPEGVRLTSEHSVKDGLFIVDEEATLTPNR